MRTAPTLTAPTLTQREVTAQLRALGVEEGSLVEVHTSFRALRPIEGGPLGLIQALRAAVGASGTLVMPTMSAGDAPFDPTSTPSLDMGVVAETFWRQPGVTRSGHPGASFAAEGPLAAEVCAPQPLAPPHGIVSPPGAVYRLGGWVLLLGVEHSEDTLIHVAESLAGVPYAVAHPCVVVNEAGEAEEVWIEEPDHCCIGFRQMDAWLGERQCIGAVGHGVARLARARDVVDTAVAALTRDPWVFVCPASAGCEACDAARGSEAKWRKM